jgi:nicotinamide-nucleotide adenylyltransferase
MDPLCARFYDLRLLLTLHDALDALDPGGPPAARVLWPPGDPPSAGRAGVLAGSFNPPTLAHTALLEHARHEQGVAHAWFLLSKHIVDKERVTGVIMEDRLLLLTLIAQSRAGFGVVLTNRGLYVDQALALRSVLGPAVEIIFVVGYDKIVQIFDPRYYTDREAALAQLFALASFLAAPRAGYTLDDLQHFLSRPENRRFAEGVRPLGFEQSLLTVSSTQVRALVAAGGDYRPYVPREVAAFIEETGAYAGPRRLAGGDRVDAYAVRAGLFQALASMSPRPVEADFRALVMAALGDTPEAAELRAEALAGRAGPVLRRWLVTPPG